MTRGIIVIGLPTEIKTADQLRLAPDTAGYATVDGVRIRSVSHLPGNIAVIEIAEGIILVPWSTLNHVLAQDITDSLSLSSPGVGRPRD